METRENLLVEEFSTAHTQVSSFLEETNNLKKTKKCFESNPSLSDKYSKRHKTPSIKIRTITENKSQKKNKHVKNKNEWRIVKEKNEIETLRDKLGLRLKKTHMKIKILRRQIEFYELAHSKLKNIFLLGLKVFKQVDFGSSASVELNKFSLEVLQKHFLEYADCVGSLCEIPTERQLENYIFQENTEFLEDSKPRRDRSNVINSSDSEDVGLDDTYFGIGWNCNKLDGGTDEDLLRDSGLESVKEEIGANEIDLSEDFSISTDFAAGETYKGRSEVVKSRNMTVTKKSGIPTSGKCSGANGSFERLKPDVVMSDENQPVAKVRNPAGNFPESPHEKNHQRNEPARGIYSTEILDETPQSKTPVAFNHSSVLEKGFFNSSREKQYQEGMTKGETYTTEARCCNSPVTATTNNTTSTMMNRGSRSPVFKDCNPRRHSSRRIEDLLRNCSTPFRPLNENFGRTLANLREYRRTSEKKKMFSRRSKYTKPRQEEDGLSGARKLRQTFLNVERFRGNDPEQGLRSQDRENDSFARDRPSDCSRIEATSEDDDDDDIIYGSPGKVNQFYINSSRKKVRQEIPEEPNHQPIPQTSAASDLDETFISPTVVRNYQMSRDTKPPLLLPPAHRKTREASPEYDSVPFAYQKGPVRKRAERMKLPGQACAECDKYYNNVYGDANASDYNCILNKCSRHRNAGGQDDTPPGYWTPFLTGS